MPPARRRIPARAAGPSDPVHGERERWRNPLAAEELVTRCDGDLPGLPPHHRDLHIRMKEATGFEERMHIGQLRPVLHTDPFGPELDQVQTAATENHVEYPLTVGASDALE